MATHPTPDKTKTRTWLVLGISFAVLILFFVLFHLFSKGNQQDPLFRIATGLSLILASTWLTITLFLVITTIFGVTDYKKGFLNFLIGDTGTYSLSRLQAVLWAIVVIAYQLEMLICLYVNPHGSFLNIYQPVLSESATWLLGLSLTSYIAVKGITVNNMTNNPALIVKQKIVPKWSDILTGANGLDFSKCQMLVWTLIAIAVFETKCYYFNGRMLWEQRDVVVKLMNHFYDEYNAKDKLTDVYPWVPFLPWSFVVLMGLSQGVYVGKKLVPTFKLDDMKADKQQELSDQVKQLQAKKLYLDNIVKNAKIDLKSPVDQANLELYKKDIADTESNIADLTAQINNITTTQNTFQGK